MTHLNVKDKVPIFSLSFGNYADKDFLRKLSLKNLGFSRHIYEAADASLQLQEFYKQISSPLLHDIKFKYDAEVEEVTRSWFPIYFRGSELVVAGRCGRTYTINKKKYQCLLCSCLKSTLFFRTNVSNRHRLLWPSRSNNNKIGHGKTRNFLGKTLGLPHRETVVGREGFGRKS